MKNRARGMKGRIGETRVREVSNIKRGREIGEGVKGVKDRNRKFQGGIEGGGGN